MRRALFILYLELTEKRYIIYKLQKKEDMRR